MSDKTNTIEIEFFCDHEGDHKTPIAECVTSKIKSFNKDDLDGINNFILEATRIFNLDKVLGVINKKLVPGATVDIAKAIN